MKNRYKEVADSLGLDENDVKEVFYSTWEFIKNKIIDLPLKSELSEEEFKKLRTTFNLPGLGKFGCDYRHYKHINEVYKKRKRDDKHKKCEAAGE